MTRCSKGDIVTIDRDVTEAGGLGSDDVTQATPQSDQTHSRPTPDPSSTARPAANRPDSTQLSASHLALGLVSRLGLFSDLGYSQT